MKDRRAAATLAACCASFFWVQSSRAVIYSAMPALSLETGLDAASVGLITGTLYAGYSVALYLSGFLPLPRRTAVVGGFLATALGNVVFAFTHELPAMLVVAALGGAGIGVYLPRGTAAIVEAFPPGARARAMGWHEVAAGVGLVIAPLFMGAALLVVSWRAAVMLWSLVGLAAALAVWRFIPDAPARAAVPAATRALLDTRALGLACMGGACFAVIGGFFTMLPTIAARAWKVSPAEAAGFTGWTRSGGLAGAFLGGVVADRMGPVPSLVAWYLLTLAAVIGVLFLDYGVGFGLLVMVMTLAASAAATAYYAVLGDAYCPEERERIFGMIQATASLIGTAGWPMALGLVLQHVSARAPLAAMTAAPLLGLAGILAYRAGAGRYASTI